MIWVVLAFLALWLIRRYNIRRVRKETQRWEDSPKPFPMAVRTGRAEGVSFTEIPPLISPEELVILEVPTFLRTKKVRGKRVEVPAEEVVATGVELPIQQTCRRQKGPLKGQRRKKDQVPVAIQEVAVPGGEANLILASASSSGPF